MTYNENIIAKAEWNSLQGVILNGGYQLLEALETNDGSAIFSVGILSGGTGKAHFCQPDPQSANEQIDIWETLREIRHPNLAAPLGTGRLKGGGAEAIYVVMADPDEKLAAIIPERALEWEERPNY